MERKAGIEKKVVTRRDFVKGTVCGTLGLAFGLKTLENSAEAAISPGMETPAIISEVVLVKDGKAVDNEQGIDATILYEMIDTAVKTFAARNMTKPWQLHICPLDMLAKAHTHRKSKGAQADQETIYAVVIPIEKYAILTDDGGARLDRAWQKANLKDERKLVIVDASRPLSHWNYKGILVGDDSVAVGSVCHKIRGMRDGILGSGEWPVNPGADRVVITMDIEYNPRTSELSGIKPVKTNWSRDTLV
jgi:hypothetical protein